MHSFDDILFEKNQKQAVQDENDKNNKMVTSVKIPYYELAFSEYSLFSELLLFQRQNMPGVFVLPSSRSSFIWNGVINVKHGLYSGGLFRFKLLIPDDFPDNNDSIVHVMRLCHACGKTNPVLQVLERLLSCFDMAGPTSLNEINEQSVIFTPAIYHPLIHSTTGQLECKHMFHPWKKNVHHIWHIIAYVKSIFTNIECTNSLNQEATETYQNSLDDFKVKVKQSIETLNLILLNDTDPDDAYAFRFNHLDDNELNSVKKQLTTMKMFSDSIVRYKSDLRTLGLTWLSEKI